jgi:GDYXXLXY motif protein
MTKAMRRRLFLAIIVLDVFFFGGWIAAEETARLRGVEVLLPVEGYDPRDLLSGHYVRFRLVAEREAAALDAAAVDYCLDERDGRHHVTRPRRAPGDCALFLRAVQPSGTRFGVERFYIDERRAGAVAIVSPGPDTYLRARLGRDGRVHPIDLVIAGRPISAVGR